MAKKSRPKKAVPSRKRPKKTTPQSAVKAEAIGYHAGGRTTEIHRSAPWEVRTTGRFIASARSLDHETVTEMIGRLGQVGLHTICDAASFPGFDQAEAMQSQAETADMILLEGFGVAILNAEPEQVERASLAQEDTAGPYRIEPEYISYAGNRTKAGTAGQETSLEGPSPSEIELPAGLSIDFLLGYQAAVNQLVNAVLSDSSAAENIRGAALPLAAAVWSDDADATWGLKATGVLDTTFTGAGVRVAILDTGIDFNHPDFVGRVEQAVSCVPGQPPLDRFGHGTHCAGTVCGPRQPASGRRYGVAPSAQLVSIKVLADNGEGRDGDIVTGMYWAHRAGCRVLNMSIHRPVNAGEGYLTYYQNAAQTILNSGGVVVSIAGNHSDRALGRVAPVASPANCPALLAVGAMDAAGLIGNFSNRAINGSGGEVDFVAPGVQVYSSFPGAAQYVRKDGTSMAAPHVTGMIAMLLEADPGMNANDVYQRLRVLSQMRPGWDPHDCGFGLARIA